MQHGGGTTTVAVTQMPCDWDVDGNVQRAETLVRRAAAQGAQVVLLQELFETPYFCPDQKQELFALARSKGHGDYEGLAWVLVAEYDTDEIFAPIFRLRNGIGIAATAVAALAALQGLAISLAVSRPLAKLGAASTEIAEGNLDVRVDIRSKDELGKLGASFNEMAGKLSVAMRKQRELAETEKANADELRAANQQLHASEQQLRASEQQLRAANQQLRTKEQTLLASREELASKVFELERFNKLMVGRELEMVRLKREVNALLDEAGQPRKYAE